MKGKIILSAYDLLCDGIPQGEEITIAHISDLHERNTAPLWELLSRQSPDLICFTGDTLERTDRGENPLREGQHPHLRKVLYSLLSAMNALSRFFSKKKLYSDESTFALLEEISQMKKNGERIPVYLSLGNHEWYLSPEDTTRLSSLGVTVLDNKDVLMHVRGIPIRIGGLSTKRDPAFLDAFSKKQEFKLLLCHHPEYFDPYLREKPIDLVLSGHVHGGQIRIFSKGLFSMSGGFFPKYHHGVYENRLVVSAGCSNTAFFPRLGNPCELVLLRLRGK